MKNSSLLLPLFKTIDKVLFGLDEMNELDKQPEEIECENEEEFVID